MNLVLTKEVACILEGKRYGPPKDTFYWGVTKAFQTLKFYTYVLCKTG